MNQSPEIIQPVEPPKRKPVSIFFPVLLVAVGLVLFLNNIGVIQGNAWDVVLKLWPLLLVLGGLDGFLKREGFVGATVFLGLGVIFLLGNFGYLNVSVWDVVLRLWPVIIIAWGLDLIVGRRGTWSPVLGIGIGLVLMAGIYWLAITGPNSVLVNMTTEPVEVGLQETDDTTARFEMAAGQLLLSGGADDANLVDGSINRSENESLRVDYTGTNGRGSLRMESSGTIAYAPVIGGITQHVWDLNLNEAVPMEVRVDMGAGEVKLDLSDIQLEGLDVNMAVGNATITLPAGDYSGQYDGAVGNVTIIIPKNVNVRINLDTAVSGVSLLGGFERNGDIVTNSETIEGADTINLRIGQAVGYVTIQREP